jgi:hypothetical protein
VVGAFASDTKEGVVPIVSGPYWRDFEEHEPAARRQVRRQPLPGLLPEAVIHDVLEDRDADDHRKFAAKLQRFEVALQELTAVVQPRCNRAAAGFVNHDPRQIHAGHTGAAPGLPEAPAADPTAHVEDLGSGRQSKPRLEGEGL